MVLCNTLSVIIHGGPVFGQYICSNSYCTDLKKSWRFYTGCGCMRETKIKIILLVITLFPDQGAFHYLHIKNKKEKERKHLKKTTDSRNTWFSRMLSFRVNFQCFFMFDTAVEVRKSLITLKEFLNIWFSNRHTGIIFTKYLYSKIIITYFEYVYWLNTGLLIIRLVTVK